MASLNRVLLIGNLTRDPEVRFTPKGSAVAELSLAINRKYKAENGEQREEVTYVDVTLWAKLAELAGQYLKKGRPVFIEGRLTLDQWEDKATGQKRSRLKVVGESMQFLGGKDDGERTERLAKQARPATAQHQQEPMSRDAGSFDDSEDIPFAPINTISAGIA